MLPSRADESPGAADGRGVRAARAAAGWSDPDTPGTAMTPTPRGLYAITPDDLDPERLAGQVARVLEGGVDWLQFRVKGGAPAQREALARRIKALCDAAGVPTRILIEGQPVEEGMPCVVELTLVSRDDLGAGYFSHDAHHDADRPLDWE